MAATDIGTQWFRSNFELQMWDHDPGSTDATVVTPNGTTQRWKDCRDVQRFAVAAMATIFGGASGITKLEIVCADDAAGANTLVVKDSGTVDADAMGDWLVLECSVSEIAATSEANGKNSQYVAGRVTCSHAGDEAVVVYLIEPKQKKLDKTPATTIS